MSEDNQPALYIELATRESFDVMRQFVAYRVEGETAPFGEIPYEAHTRYRADIDRLVRAAIRAGKRSVYEQD